ncbi:MAG: 4-(cytidine 5'-diphospho)-2-C-methyl-D-erythritol kinase, partial [Nitrospirota bacterium]
MKKDTQIIVQAPAKVNLSLEVTGKRPDGYHDIISVMQALELSDEVKITLTGGGIEVVCDSPGVPEGLGNVAYQAAKALFDHAGYRGGARVEITKRIPVAAGLGGGSSDAAAVLRGLNILLDGAVTDERLREIGATIGADVPFFLSWPVALAEGIGERLKPLQSFGEIWLVLLKPAFGVSTAWVYSQLNLGLTKKSSDIKLSQLNMFIDGTAETAEAGLPAADASIIASCLKNDLERVTVVRYPEIDVLKRRLTEAGALGALMSGSGSTVFGVFRTKTAAENAATRLADTG